MSTFIASRDTARSLLLGSAPLQVKQPNGIWKSELLPRDTVAEISAELAALRKSSELIFFDKLIGRYRFLFVGGGTRAGVRPAFAYRIELAGTTLRLVRVVPGNTPPPPDRKDRNLQAVLLDQGGLKQWLKGRQVSLTLARAPTWSWDLA